MKNKWRVVRMTDESTNYLLASASEEWVTWSLVYKYKPISQLIVFSSQSSYIHNFVFPHFLLLKSLPFPQKQSFVGVFLKSLSLFV